MAPSPQSLGFLPVSTATLCAAGALDFNLYLQWPGRPAELYREKSYPLTTDDLQRLCAGNVSHLYIRFDDAELFRKYLQDHVLHGIGVPAPMRFRALRDLTRVAFEDALRQSSSDSVVNVATSFGHDLAGMLTEQTPVLEDLFKTLEHDYYTFTHACNVSTYCAVMALRLQRYDAVEVAEIAAGGLLHDIGKRHIPPHILNKQGKLTDQEWSLVKQHPITGYRELVSRPDLNEGQLMMVYQHHERLDGSGYPTGIIGNDIHPWANICAVADVFDAMTCKRSYRHAIRIGEVLAHLRNWAGKRFDSEVVDCWTSPLVASC